MNPTQRTELKELGEFGLIRKISTGIELQNKESVTGIGDDAAVIDTGADQYTLISTDMLLEGVHFDLSYVPLQHLGYKAVAVNVSDVAAMNGIPKQITVAIALSSRFSVEAVEALYAGIKAACTEYKVDLIGGDTTTSKAGLVISITVLGMVNKSKVVYRHTAKPNDIICTSGDLGGAFIGLQLLEREKQVFLANPEAQPQLEGKDYVIKRQLKPEARMDIVYELDELGIVPTSMIDISDGLASELLHLCTRSGTGAVIFEDKIPIDGETYNTAAEFNIDPVTCALNGGEDYELLFTIRQEDFPKLKNHPDVFFLGYMTNQPEDIHLVTKAENKVPIRAQGWVHF